MRFLFPYLWLLAMLALCSITEAAGTERGIAVIMASGAAHPRLHGEEVALIFQLKKRFLNDGLRIHAVNLPVMHPLRRAFSVQVLGRNPEELDAYWRDMYFHGVMPPHVLLSEEAVIRFVASTPGAIAYVSRCLVDHRVSVVLQLDSGIACPR